MKNHANNLLFIFIMIIGCKLCIWHISNYSSSYANDFMSIFHLA